MGSPIIAYIKTIRFLFFWKIMVSHQAVNSLNISTSDFFVTDMVHKVDISVECFSTGEMTKYLLTKPNRGSIFKGFRDLGVVVMTQVDPSNVKQGNRQKK